MYQLMVDLVFEMLLDVTNIVKKMGLVLGFHQVVILVMMDILF